MAASNQMLNLLTTRLPRTFIAHYLYINLYAIQQPTYSVHVHVIYLSICLHIFNQLTQNDLRCVFLIFAQTFSVSLIFGMFLKFALTSFDSTKLGMQSSSGLLLLPNGRM